MLDREIARPVAGMEVLVPLIIQSVQFVEMDSALVQKRIEILLLTHTAQQIVVLHRSAAIQFVIQSKQQEVAHKIAAVLHIQGYQARARMVVEIVYLFIIVVLAVV